MRLLAAITILLILLWFGRATPELPEPRTRRRDR
jgi:hypothetical protein